MEQKQEQRKNTPPRQPWLLRFIMVFIINLILIAVWLCIIILVAIEERSSELQAKYFSAIVQNLTYQVAPGASDAIRYPEAGPSDQRRGYVDLPAFIKRAGEKGYTVEAQTRLSPDLIHFCDLGIFPPYHEKPQAGLEIYDRRGQTLFDMTYPAHIYSSFEAIPEIIVKSLLFVENRELLDPRYPCKNPAVDWTRLGKAMIERVINKATGSGRGPGGSTLATQIEKYRHSPEGLTSSIRDKIVQMASASLQSYMGGQDTLDAQMGIILDYINSIPLGAYPGYGEIIGIGDGLWAWYSADFEAVNRTLSQRPLSAEDKHLAPWALAFKQLLSLFIAQRRPGHYLRERLDQLEKQTQSYVRVLEAQGIITAFERDAAIKAPLRIRPTMPAQYEGSFLERKPANAIRTRLMAMLDVPQLYGLDRLDLTVSGTLDAKVQEEITWSLHKLKEPAFARQSGLYGLHLLTSEDPGKIVYSFTLYERGEQANLLRIMTDTNDQPLNINEGIKLELGSTAKLRTMVGYLEIIGELHGQFAGRSTPDLETLDTAQFDTLSKWAVDYLAAADDRSLPAMLNAAMERVYSASPAESFFTGGGPHTFANFNPEDSGKVMDVRSALRQSVNLVFIRLMRDIVQYFIFLRHESTSGPLAYRGDPARKQYLASFADTEGQKYLSRFYGKYKGKTADEALKTLVSGIVPAPVRLAVIYRSIMPEKGLADFSAFVKSNLPSSELSGQTLRKLYDKYGPGSFSLVDRGFLAHVHPLELWTVAYLREHPEATQAGAVRDSTKQRQEVYTWLFKTRDKAAQDTRIQIMMENEAFQEVHRMWKRLGYPFDSLVPSYATAIGSSADRPAALAELVGILVNKGIYAPAIRIEKMHFAAGTPYETVIKPAGNRSEQVMKPEVAEAARRELLGVVERGTATRISKVFTRPDGTSFDVGGKTGTGDNRFDVYNAAGDLVRSTAINRTATFVFFIGERFFGTLTAYVPGQQAADYSFTSSLPVQVLKTLAPKLMPLINGIEPDAESARVAPPARGTAASDG
jgi:membrane peptidoglycan carboxypeptidase